MKICPVGAKFYVVSQRNMMKLVVVFRNSANTLKIRWVSYCVWTTAVTVSFEHMRVLAPSCA